MTDIIKKQKKTLSNRHLHFDLADHVLNGLEVKGRSLWGDARARFFKNKAACLSLILLCLITLVIIVAPWFSACQYDDIDWLHMSEGPSWHSGHLFGTDNLGRDIFVRTMVGGRISLLIGLLGAIVSCTIGLIYGAVAGVVGSRTDILMMRVVEILSSLPFTFLVILLVTFLGRSIFLIFIAIGAVSWLDMARVVRGQALSLRKREFIEAAHISGSSSWQTVTRHIIPNTLGVVIICLSLLVPTLILFESFLSFLGLGVQEPMTSWGALVNDGAQAMEVNHWQLIFPVSFLTVTLFCLNFIGDGLRDALDPKSH